MINYNKIIDITIRIFKMIERIQEDNHNLRRPFIYKNEVFKESKIIEMKFLREKLETQYKRKMERFINSHG